MTTARPLPPSLRPLVPRTDNPYGPATYALSYDDADQRTHRAVLTANDPSSGLLVVHGSPEPAGSAVFALARDLLVALGKDPKLGVRTWHSKHHYLEIPAVWALAHGVTDILLLHAELTAERAVDHLGLLAAETQARLWLAFSPGPTQTQMAPVRGWALFGRTAPSVALTDTVPATPVAPTRTTDEKADPGDGPVPVEALPRVDCFTFWASCTRALPEDDLARLVRPYLHGLRLARSVVHEQAASAASAQATAHELLHRFEHPVEVLVALRGAQLVFAEQGTLLNVDTNRFIAGSPTLPAMVTARSTWLEVDRLRDPVRAFALVLDLYRVPVVAMARIRVGDLAPDGSGVRGPATPEGVSIHPDARHIGRALLARHAQRGSTATDVLIGDGDDDLTVDEIAWEVSAASRYLNIARSRRPRLSDSRRRALRELGITIGPGRQ